MGKPEIKIRQAKKKKQDTFANIQQPHPVAELLNFPALTSNIYQTVNTNIAELTQPRETASETADSMADNTTASTTTSTAESPTTSTADSNSNSPADSPTDSPANNLAANTAESLADSHAFSPVNSRAESTTDSGANSMAGSLVDSPSTSTALTKARKTINAITRRNLGIGRILKKSPKVQGQPLDATHTASEKSVYSVMYRLTITAGENPRRFTNPELQALTGINSNTTIGRALKGLCAKLSVVITNRQGQNRHGIEIYVRPPSEILTLRQEAGLQIEPVRKEIIAITNPQIYEQLIRLNFSNETADDMAGETAGSHAGSPTASMGFLPHPDLSKMHVQQPASLLINKYSDATPKKTGASSPIRAEIDATKLAQVRELFTELSNGGKWKPERDEPAYLEIQHVPLWHIIVGLANSLIRCTEHRFSSLKYAVPAILEHYDKMKLFPEKEMLGVAYSLMSRALNCRDAGKWSIPEWETGKPLPPDPEQDC